MRQRRLSRYAEENIFYAFTEHGWLCDFFVVPVASIALPI